MGRALAAAAESAACTIVGGTEVVGAAALGSTIGEGLITESVIDAAAQAEVWIDFTTPKAACAAIEALKPSPVRALVIGATGFSVDQDAAIAAAASRFAIVKSGNFSLGVNLLAALVEQAASRLKDWDIEIIEAHHRHKVDAPSGTALLLGEAAARGRGALLKDLTLPPRDGVTGARPDHGIGFAVVRAGAIVGDHSVLLAGAKETLTLTHHAQDRALFAEGALMAARWAAQQTPGLYSMRDVLGL